MDDRQIASELARLGVATLYEAAGLAGWVAGLTRISGTGAVAGRARTAVCAPFDNLGLLHRLADTRPGDLLVVVSDTPSVDHTFLGDVIGTQARELGVSGIVVDGLVRDADGLRDIGIPVWARGVAPYSPRKNGPYALDVPVNVSGVSIRPGDWVALDSDGAVVLPAEEAERTIEQAVIRFDRELEMRSRIQRGELLIDIAGLR